MKPIFTLVPVRLSKSPTLNLVPKNLGEKLVQKRHFEFAFQWTVLLTYGYEKNVVAHGELAETDLVSTFFRLKKKTDIAFFRNNNK